MRRGVLKTPPLASVLEGITRDAVITIARDKGIEVIETTLTRDEVYCADEVFLTGSGARIVPIATLDGERVGTEVRDRPGPVTQALPDAYPALAREHGTPF